MRYFWGLTLLLVGSSYLAASLGYLNYSDINKLWLWWPLILIFIGFDLLLKRFKYGWFFMIALSLLFGIIIYDVSLAPTSYLFPNQRVISENRETESVIKIVKYSKAQKSKIGLKTGMVDLKISGGSKELVTGTLKSNITELLEKSVISGDEQIIELASNPISKQMMWFRGVKNILNLNLTNDLPIFLTIDAGASRLDLDLTDVKVSGVEINAGASTIDLRLGSKIINGSKVLIDAGASTINISIPKNLGVRIKSESGLVTQNLPDFVKNGNYYENEQYSKSSTKIEFEIRSGVSTINVTELN
jgi:hypothetical protein